MTVNVTLTTTCFRYNMAYNIIIITIIIIVILVLSFCCLYNNNILYTTLTLRTWHGNYNIFILAIYISIIKNIILAYPKNLKNAIASAIIAFQCMRYYTTVMLSFSIFIDLGLEIN